MRIPTKGRYAVSAMLSLAINERYGPVTIADIAERLAISLSYLEQLFARLRKQGLVEGTRGPGGGYRLARPASDISVADIIKAVDEKALADQKADHDYLPYVLWSDLSRRLHQFLDSISLADCVKQGQVDGYDDPSGELGNGDGERRSRAALSLS